MANRKNKIEGNSKAVLRLIVFITVFFFAEEGIAQPTFTQCQWQDNPETVSNAFPTFSWKTEGQQTAYQIMVSTDLSELKANKSDSWDSGKVNSKKNIGITYSGGTLKRNTTYYWKVKVWMDGVASEYSEPKSFKMGNNLIAVSPQNEIIAESWETITFKIIVGDGGVPVGNGFSILSPTAGNRFKWKVKFLSWSTWQTTNPESAGYTTVSTTRDGAKVVPEVVGERNVLNLKIADKDLQPGDIITVVYGDKSKGSPGVQVSALAQRCFFPLCKLNDTGETWGARAWEKYKDAPSVEIVGNKASKFNVVANPLQKAGKKFSLKVMAIDDKGNLDVNFRGNLSFHSSDNLAELPGKYTFTQFDQGMHRFDVVLKTTGLNTITVSKENVTGKSNVIDVSVNEQESNIYFGDFHGHSWFSDGMHWIDDHYIYARDVAGLDFAGVTDHTENPYNFTKEFVIPYAKRFYKPSEFVTLYSYEWTRGDGFGHLNPLFLNENEFDIFNASDYKTPDELWKALKGREVITPPHHPASRANGGAGGYNWDFYNKEFLKTVEIASKHGISECMPEDGNPYPIRGGMNPARTVQYALGEKGYKLGIIGSSDAHATRLGELYHPNGGYETSVITAVYSNKLSREAIYYAIKNRNTYATTGEKILVEFNINGNQMGSEFNLSKGAKPTISFKVGGTNKIKELVVWKYSKAKGWEKKFVQNVDSETVSNHYTDNEFEQNSLYYLRVTQYGSPLELAWTSPIWVNLSK
ncbi:MAG: CehA/McbA family metallohydrolase [Bacteroidetes bacterium]|nr:CehA/McbA family metallohydrolase [Bacteroidota bacterium]